MKTKTRVLAMLLTVLMVVGILPLSLFALDSVEPLDVNASTGSGAYVDRTLDQIKTEFKKQDVALGMYMSFGNLSNEQFESIRGAINTWQAYISKSGVNDKGLGAYVDMYEYVDASAHIAICDHKKAASIVDGALYFGNTPGKKADGVNVRKEDGSLIPDSELEEGKTPYNNNHETYLQFNPFDGNGNGSQDVYVSMDVKMNGDKMSSTNMFTVVWRHKSGVFLGLLKAESDGTLKNGDEVVGKLSKETYTRLALVLSRTDNKYYIYINDVLVNIGGDTLISDTGVQEYNTGKGSTSYTSRNIPIESIRAYVVSDNYADDGKHDGVFFDNLVVGKKVYTKTDKETADKLYVQSNFANATSGTGVKPESQSAVPAAPFGTINDGAMDWGVLDDRAVIYFDEDGDGKVDCIKFQKASKLVTTEKCAECGKDNCECDQAYLQIQGKAGTSNATLSMSLKMGGDSILGNEGGFIWMRYDTSTASRATKNILNIASDGTVKTHGGYVIGKLSKTEYVNVRVDLVANTTNGIAFVYYINGEIKNVSFYNETIKSIECFRIYNKYNDSVETLKEDDIHMKDIVYKATSQYNYSNATPITCFATLPFGFIEKNGVLRYYDGQGGYMTEDFFVGTTKYMVGNDGEVISKIPASITTKTLDEIKKAFDKQDIQLVHYQTFQNWAMEGDYFDWAGSSLSVPGDDKRENVNAFADFSTAGMQLKNNRNSYSIRKDADGNKALFYNWSVKPAANADNFMDIMTGTPDSFTNQQGNATHDYYFSIDVKMNGVNVTPGSLVNLIYRPEAYGGANARAVISLSAVGGIYVGGYEQNVDLGPDGLVGFLSQDAYTRIAFATDRANNKYYVYINDVLVNPEGTDLFTQYEVDRMNKTNTRNDVVYTANNIPICNLRVGTSTGHDSSDVTKGIYYDNILLGTRVAVKPTTTPSAVKAYDFAALGQSVDVTDANGLGPVIDAAILNGGATSIGADGDIGTIRWVDEDGDGKADAIEGHWLEGSMGTLTPATAQGFFNINNPAGSVVTNLRVNLEIKGGQDGQKDYTKEAFFWFRSGQNYFLKVFITTDGDIKTNGGKVIGKINKDEYTTITVDLIYNTVDGTNAHALYYIDGEYKAFEKINISQTFKAEFIRLYCAYNGTDVHQVASFKDQDIRMKSVSFGTTTDYDGYTRMNPFEQVLEEGFYGAGGIFRYYNGNGTYKTADFVLNGEKYLVSENGFIYGKESAGVNFAPYAPYVDWAHTGTLLHDKPDGSLITVDNSPIKFDRDGYAQTGTDDGKPVYLYQSFYDAEPGTSPNDHTSYTNINFANGLKNTSLVIDMDIKLSDSFVNKPTSKQSFIYLRGQETSANGGARKDVDFQQVWLDGNGWFTVDGRKVAKLSNTEYSRVSVVIHGPQLDSSDNLTANSKVDIYVNGVIIATLENTTGAKYLQQVRFFKMNDCDFTAYFKNTYTYNATKPQQFVTMQAGAPVLTSDASKTPATPADLKQGFVMENGVVRYYDELGLPVIGGSFEFGGKTYTADANGVVPMPCVGDTHVGMDSKGECTVCGAKADGVSSLYGNSLILGSDVKVVFYLDLVAEKAKAVEIGIAGRDVKTYALEDLETVAMGGKTLYKVEYAVSGKDICTEITVKVVKADDTYANSYTYSAAQYAADVQLIDTDEVYTAELKALANALLVYGKTAAAVLANGESYEVTDEVSFENVADATGSPDLIGMAVKLNKFTLELKSNIKFKVYFTIDAEAALLAGIMPEDYVATVNGTAVDITEIGDGLYSIELEILAAALGETLNIAIKDGLNGFGIDLSICPLYYAKIVASSDSMDADYKNLAKAIKLYADAAAAYANEIAEDSRPAL